MYTADAGIPGVFSLTPTGQVAGWKEVTEWLGSQNQKGFQPYDWLVLDDGTLVYRYTTGYRDQAAGGDTGVHFGALRAPFIDPPDPTTWATQDANFRHTRSVLAPVHATGP